jgi:hypothetical protein
VGSLPALYVTKGCTRLAAASDKVDQLLAHGRWFSLGTPASSTTNTGRYDRAEILLKAALNTKIQIQIKSCVLPVPASFPFHHRGGLTYACSQYSLILIYSTYAIQVCPKSFSNFCQGVLIDLNFIILCINHAKRFMCLYSTFNDLVYYKNV